ncbi:hypothetical protein L6R53_17590 [Myxococcota bacterium]|nr:hypothetical protein [Myxococcota bacterium]
MTSPAPAADAPRRTAAPPLSDAARTLLTLAFYGLLSVAFTWPLVLSGGDALHTRQFDQYGVVWMATRGVDLLPDLVDPSTNYPLGASVELVDAWIHLALAAATQAILTPLQQVALLVLVGPVLTAWAAERLAARGLGVRFPWSLLAGVAFGFSGLAATAWLEGHVYFLLDPWLPLLALWTLRATSRAGRPVHGLLAGAAWVLCLATTAYLALIGALVAAVMLLRGALLQPDRRRLARATAPMALVVGVASAAYAASFLGVDSVEETAPDGWVLSGVASLGGLAAWTPAVDMVRNHSISAPLGAGTLGLVLFAPRVLRGLPGWRTWLGLAVAGLVLAFGPAVQVGLDDRSWAATPLLFATDLPVWRKVHFPVRMMWLWYLGGGLVAALVADRLARRVGGAWVAPLFVVVLIDALVGTGAPLRARQTIAATPSAYQAAPPDGPLLDLLGQPPFEDRDDDFAVVGHLLCYYQATHRRPVLDPCVKPLRENPRAVVGREVLSLLIEAADPPDQHLGQRVEAVRSLLEALGIRAVAVHLDLLPNEIHAVVLGGMEQVAAGPPARVSSDGGETIALFVLPAGAPTDPRAAYEALARAHRGEAP